MQRKYLCGIVTQKISTLLRVSEIHTLKVKSWRSEVRTMLAIQTNDTSEATENCIRYKEYDIRYNQICVVCELSKYLSYIVVLYTEISLN